MEQPTQPAIDALAPDGWEWKVRGVPGFLISSGKNRKSFRPVRRVHGRLVKRTLESRSPAEAKPEVIRGCRSLIPKPVEAQPMPALPEGSESCLSFQHLAGRTRREYEAVMQRSLGDWVSWRLDATATDRAGFRKRILETGKKHGEASAALLPRTCRDIHNRHRKVLTDLPGSPSVTCGGPRVPPRDGALSDEELVYWWSVVQGLSPFKRVWWLTALLNGCPDSWRAGSTPKGKPQRSPKFLDHAGEHRDIGSPSRAHVVPALPVLQGFRSAAPGPSLELRRPGHAVEAGEDPSRTTRTRPG